MRRGGPRAARRYETRRVKLVLEYFAAGLPVEEISRRMSLRPANIYKILAGAGIGTTENNPAVEDDETHDRHPGRLGNPYVKKGSSL